MVKDVWNVQPLLWDTVYAHHMVVVRVLCVHRDTSPSQLSPASSTSPRAWPAAATVASIVVSRTNR